MRIYFTFFILLVCAALTVWMVGPVTSTEMPISPEQEEKMLASTVQIAMFEYSTNSIDEEQGSVGLGTLVRFGEEQLIITHDHWSHLTSNLHEVEFSDCRGELLLTLDAWKFQQLIIYKDGGTMVLRSPTGMNGLVAAEIGNKAGIGDIVYVARRTPSPDQNSVEFIHSIISEVKLEQEPTKLLLKNLDGSPVQAGDSGGGVWANGRLVANVWAAGRLVNMNRKNTVITDDSGRPTDLIVAAMQPLGRKLGVELLTPETDQTVDPVLDHHDNEDLLPKEAFLEEILTE